MVPVMLAGGAWLSIRYPATQAEELVTLIARDGPDSGYRALAYPYQRAIGRGRFAHFVAVSGLRQATTSAWRRDTIGQWLRRGQRYRVEGVLTLNDGRRLPAAMVLGRPCARCRSVAIWSIAVGGHRP